MSGSIPPTWGSATPTSGIESSETNQFLSLHETKVVHQGSQILDLWGAVAEYVPVAGVVLDQSFVQPTGETAIDWVRLAITSVDIAAPTSPPSYDEAVDVTVAIYTDSSGNPGTLLGQTTIPSEYIEAVSTDSWPEPQDCLFSDAQYIPPTPGSPPLIKSLPDAQVLVSVAAGQAVVALVGQFVLDEGSGVITSGSATITSLTAGIISGVAPGMAIYGTMIPANTTILSTTSTTITMSAPATASSTGGWSASSLLYTFVSQLSGTTFSPWAPGPTVPGFGIPILAWCPTAQALVCGVDKGDSSGTHLYSATLTPNGDMSSWQTIAAQGSATDFPIIACLTYSGQDYLTLIGGLEDVSGGADTQITQYAAIDATGTVGSWSYGVNFPIVTDSQLEPPIGGSSAAENPPATWAMIGDTLVVAAQRVINGGTVGALVNGWSYYGQSSPGGEWTPWGGAFGTQFQAALVTTLGVSLGNQIVYFGQYVNTDSQTPTQALGANGSAWWTTTQVIQAVANPVSASIALGDGSDQFVTLGVPPNPNSATQIVYPCTWVNVPLGITGLTAGSTYHLVVSGAAGSLAAGAQVPIVGGGTYTPGGTAFPVARSATSIAGPWTAQNGNLRAMVFAAGALTGPVLGLIEDNGDRVSVVWYDQPSGVLLTAAQWCGTVREVQVLGYTDGVLTSIETPS